MPPYGLRAWDKRQLELTVYDVLLEAASIEEARQVAESADITSWAPTANCRR